MTRGLALYQSRPDKEWFLTDCISFVVMQERGMSEEVIRLKHSVSYPYLGLLYVPGQ